MLRESGQKGAGKSLLLHFLNSKAERAPEPSVSNTLNASLSCECGTAGIHKVVTDRRRAALRLGT
jgi:hypothetical protein